MPAALTCHKNDKCAEMVGLMGKGTETDLLPPKCRTSGWLIFDSAQRPRISIPNQQPKELISA